MEIVKLDPSEIIAENRWREDLGDLKELAKSIKKFGNILPVIINRNNYLIDGERRVRAAALAEVKVTCVYNDTVDPFKMKELELEANLHRKDFTPAEKATAVKDLHKLMQSQYGESSSGASGGWTIEDTAKKMNVSPSRVAKHLKTAAYIEEFPQLKNLEKESDINRAVKALGKLCQAVSGVKEFENILCKTENPFELHQVDSIDFIPTIPDNSIDILLTDPLYGIEHDKLMIGAGGKTGGQSSIGYKFDDNTEKALRVYKFLAFESFRFTTSTAHCYLFIGTEHFYTIRGFFIEAGFECYIKPIIWIKRTTGSNNSPEYWPSDCYESILYARKKDSKIIKEGMPNWIECLPVLLSEKTHQYEKPIKLLDNLLQRCCLPGQKLLDPFMGSGSSIEAGVTRKLYCTGCDISQEAYSFAVKRMVEFVMGRKDR